ncbi:glutamate receptor ionotropic, NMDA 1-like isoform X1 [Amphiura filiformis]|uniref:glutamate receptor ionotropic, NMDA 1-like isoform X1 n=1 Tax=Amphiura filiformis TaxID=82378 RepID=UPI003B21A85F
MTVMDSSMYVQVLAFILLYSKYHCLGVASYPAETIMIGAMLSSDEENTELQQAIRDLNQNNRILPGRYELNVTSIVMDNNPIQSALTVCEMLIPKQVYAVISSHTKELYLSSVSVSYTCGFYHIPVIGISARESIFSDKDIHKSYLRTVPPYSHQAYVWADIVDAFGWKQVVVMTTNDQDGRSILTLLRRTLEEHADLYKFEIEKAIQFKHGETNMTKYLVEAKTCQATVVLLYASEQDATNIYNDAHRLNMTRAGYAWIVTEQSITGNALQFAPEGLLAIKLHGGTNTSAHISDALKVVAKGYHSYLQTDGPTNSGPPQHCRTDVPWESGHIFYKNMVEAIIPHGSIGRIEFDSSGDMIAADYKIENLQNGNLVQIGSWMAGSDPVDIHKPNSIVWPGGARTPPVGFEISNHFRVVSIKSHPFTYVDPTLDDGSCLEDDALECTDHEGNAKCCSGFCMDLLVKLSTKLNFTFEVHLVTDENYGAYERINGSTTKRWTGLIGDLVDGKADMIVAPLSINQAGSNEIDFTKPYKYRGFSILIKRPINTNNLSQVVRPFETKLWIVIFASIHLVAVILYLLDRFSPFSRPKRNQDEPDSCNISQAVWFTWSVMFNSGVGEGTPRSFAARVLGVVWAGFAMIIVASYTANLAAYLVLDKPKGGIMGINDARIRNPSASFKYATVQRSSVETYFKRQVELSSMYLFMKDRNYKNAQDAIDALKRDEIQAFIWDSAMLDYEAARDCSLVTVGELFGRSGFGIGLRFNSPWTYKMSLKILNFHENGVMEELDSKWIRRHNICSRSDDQPRTLEMSSMGGVFILVAGGLVFSCFCIWVEILYKRKQDAKKRQLDLARVAVENWRSTVKVRLNFQAKLQELLTKERRRAGKMLNQVSQSSAAEKHNGVQGPAALEKEMDGTMPACLLSRRSQRSKLPPPPTAASRWNSAGHSAAMQARQPLYGEFELKERV